MQGIIILIRKSEINAGRESIEYIFDHVENMAVYYVDVLNGKPGNSGLSESMPLSDYSAVNIKPGDTILFKRGTFIRGRLNNISGENRKPVTYAAYGEGKDPVFCGSISLNDPSLWKQESENIWQCLSDQIGEAANFIFNRTHMCGTLRWSKNELVNQGDFFDNCFGVSNECKPAPKNHELYLYSTKNPALYYSDIECCACSMRSLADTGHDIVFRNLHFINNALHAIAGENESRNIKIEDCSFEFIGGAVYDDKRKIRYGNAVEFWNIGENIEITGCYFNNIYDSAITHQGNGGCKPCVNLNCHGNVFVCCGMAAYEQRDKLPLYASFSDNICIDAGECFSKNGEIMPRFSEIWPLPMGHHIFLWRIESGTEGGKLEIRNNIFYNAPYGAAIYSIISEAAENQVRLKNNIYYTKNKRLLNRWNGIDFAVYDEYKKHENNCRWEKVNIAKRLKDWRKRTTYYGEKRPANEKAVQLKTI